MLFCFSSCHFYLCVKAILVFRAPLNLRLGAKRIGWVNDCSAALWLGISLFVSQKLGNIFLIAL